MIRQIEIEVSGQGLHEITDRVQRAVAESGVEEGLATLFLRHTSASLTIQENADPSARRDLENLTAAADLWKERIEAIKDRAAAGERGGAADLQLRAEALWAILVVAVPILGALAFAIVVLGSDWPRESS